MNATEVKRIAPEEVARLQRLSRETFFETFSPLNTAENMKRYLEREFSTEKLEAELRDPESAFYFALQGQQEAGYLKLNFGESQTDLKAADAVEIERIYVRSEFQGKRVGQRLLDFAIQVARERKAHYIWLGVWEENVKAIRFYQKNGFLVFGKHLFMLGKDEQTDLKMKLVL